MVIHFKLIMMLSLSLSVHWPKIVSNYSLVWITYNADFGAIFILGTVSFFLYALHASPNLIRFSCDDDAECFPFCQPDQPEIGANTRRKNGRTFPDQTGPSR